MRFNSLSLVDRKYLRAFDEGMVVAYETSPALEEFNGVFMHLVAFALLGDAPDIVELHIGTLEISADDSSIEKEAARSDESDAHEHAFITVGEDVWTGDLYQRCSCGTIRIARLA